MAVSGTLTSRLMIPQTKGDHSELRVASRLKRLGWSVLFPFSDNKKYDIVAENNGEYRRIQVKTGRYIGPSVKFHCYNSNSARSGNNMTEYTSTDIDGFAVYCDETCDMFWVPISDSNSKTMRINVDQDGADNPADEYGFDDAFRND